MRTKALPVLESRRAVPTINYNICLKSCMTSERFLGKNRIIAGTKSRILAIYERGLHFVFGHVHNRKIAVRANRDCCYVCERDAVTVAVASRESALHGSIFMLYECAKVL